MDNGVFTDNETDTSISIDNGTFTNSHTNWNNSTEKLPFSNKCRFATSYIDDMQPEAPMSNDTINVDTYISKKFQSGSTK
jgi:hypothetical protein